ncbi:hypothetical protein NL676_014126 [Syzygium grande]|nr:hypothetical protein NL676_014126 [Syzygium grande]
MCDIPGHAVLPSWLSQINGRNEQLGLSRLRARRFGRQILVELEWARSPRSSTRWDARQHELGPLISRDFVLRFDYGALIKRICNEWKAKKTQF